MLDNFHESEQNQESLKTVQKDLVLFEIQASEKVVRRAGITQVALWKHLLTLAKNEESRQSKSNSVKNLVKFQEGMFSKLCALPRVDCDSRVRMDILDESEQDVAKVLMVRHRKLSTQSCVLLS
ncbi:hypothetical protein TNCV_4085741 [Trichonephila clavipes]|nr:hypothetical protein TNCV_4085741 [Trichonephila clavipes]